MGKERNRFDEWRRVLNDKGVVIEGKEEVKAVGLAILRSCSINQLGNKILHV